ncbi:MAG TPA: cation:proton antiporter, partial [Calditrichia bacterium]|nr:cation:proton antiporter [Calditrichia bacterium]
MEPILTLGIIIFTGFVAGELCSRIGLPKVTGYVLAGMLLNPNLSPIIPASFVEQTGLVTSISLAFITFSVGGTLLFPRIRALGKPIVLITLFEAEFAFLFVAALVIFLGPTFIEIPGATRISFFLPLALLLGALASPTDPSATLAVEHEFQARGEVTSTIMGVAAFDDILGIINYSLAVSVAGIFILDEPLGSNVVVHPLLKILGSIGLGILFGLILNGLLKIIKKETESVLITVIISLLSLCYGLAGLAGADELLSTMTMGVIVVNYSYKKEKVFNILERYTEELIFVLFFTLSAMHLDFSV